MNVSLVVPDFLSGTSFLQQPLDFLYCASILERCGHHVCIIDCRTSHYSKEQIIHVLQKSDLIVLTTTPCDQVQNYFVDYRYGYAIRLCNNIKKTLPHIPLAICGAHGSVRPDLVEKEADADIIICGEVMSTVQQLVQHMQEGMNLTHVPNLELRIENEWAKTPTDMALWHPVLDDDILPAFHKVPMISYFGVEYVDNVPLRRQNRAVLQGGRGCPFSCSFCHNFYGRNVRRRSVDIVVKEMELCQRQYGVKEIFFLDELFTMDKSWILSFGEEIQRRKLSLSLTIQTRTDCLDDEILASLYLAGVKDIWLGIESGDDRILKISNKEETIAELVPTIDKIRYYGMRPNAFFMLGMPGETVESINKTLKTIYDEKIPYTRSIMICTPRYGTPYYKLAVKQYPYVEEHWYNLNAVKGLVANDMTPSILQKAKDILKDRNFLYKSHCPQI